MSLRMALKALPDDRATAHAVHEVIACFTMHVGEPLLASRISRSTALDLDRVVPVLEALAASDVVDCDGSPSRGSCTFEPDAVLRLEVERYVRAGGPDVTRTQANLGKFRSRFGQG